MNSKIYVGTVNHTRIAPAHHSFRYPIYMYAFDLAELPDLDKNCVFFGYNRLRPVSLYSKDYFDSTDAPLLDKTKAFIDTYAPEVADVSQVSLLTSARYFNYVFNPVSFFYCYNDRQTLTCILAYVNNTFRESHVYWEQEDENEEDTGEWARGDNAPSNPSWICYIVAVK